MATSIHSLFNAEEMTRLVDTAKQDPKFTGNTFGGTDKNKRSSKLSLWGDLSDDLYSMFSRSERLVNNVETLLGQEVYHWHSKMMLKEAKVGGSWEWHQDYGYWYNNGCLRPDLLSCMIAVDHMTQANGCLEVLVGSHKMGRINHGTLEGGQTGADLERTEAAQKSHQQIYVELAPGDVLFFHSNLMHGSGPNLSEHPRWSLICCYNAATNEPLHPGPGHGLYEPISKVSDEAILNHARNSETLNIR